MHPARRSYISSIPAEILSWIFILVCTMRPCARPVWEYLRPPKFTNRPIILSHVCATWRRVAISTSRLWTHIDLDPTLLPDGRLSPNAKTHLSRAGDRLLDVHAVLNHFYDCDSAPTIAKENSFIELLETISPRAWSMTVEIPDGNPVLNICQRTISAVLENCTPGVLTQLSINVLKHSSSPSHPQTPPEQLNIIMETLGQAITVLQLCNYFPQWTSKMYHGLTELHLKGHREYISQSALRSILKSSPKLRILEIGTYITGLDYQGPITPVLLTDLELFIVSGHVPWHEVLLFRMIQLGPKPLTFSIHGSLITSFLFYNSRWDDRAVERFFANANITQLIIRALDDYGQLARFLPLILNVTVLALDNPYYTRVISDETTAPPASTIDALYVTTSPCSVPKVWPALEQFIRRHDVRKTTWWAHEAEGGVPKDLFSMCPQVTIVSHEEGNPIQEFLHSNDSSLF